MKAIKETKVTRSSGNVFADIGLPNAEELLLKAKIASLISKKIDGLSQVEAAARMGTTQSNVSNIVTGRLDRFSVLKLLNFVQALGQDVEIKVKPARHSAVGRLTLATVA